MAEQQGRMNNVRRVTIAAFAVFAVALFLLSVAVFLFLKALTIKAEPVQIPVVDFPEAKVVPRAPSIVARLVEPPSAYYTLEERLVVLKERLARFISQSRRKPYEDIESIVGHAIALGEEYNVNPLLILAVITVESGFDEQAVSPAGAMGLMQVHVRVHADKFDPHGGEDKVFDRYANMSVGTQILAHYIRQQGTTAGALKFYVGAGRRRTDGGYGRSVFREESRLLVAAEKTPESALALVRLKKDGPAAADLSGQKANWNEFVDFAMNAPM